MDTISTNDFRSGISIILDGEVYTIVESQHVKPGKGGAFVRTKLKNLKTGYVLDKTFKAEEKIERAYVEKKKMQYLYNDGEYYHFMDLENYEQYSLPKEAIKDIVKFLKENIEVLGTIYEGTPITVELPNFIELKVVETEPGFKGDTASGGGKPATLETGAVIQVPFFVNVGDVVKIDTRTGEYVERV